MSNVIIGIDPDSSRYGIAIYRDGNLTELLNMNIIELYEHITQLMKKDDIHIHLEDVKRSKAVWHAQGMNKSVAAMASQKVGMCKQSQTAIEQMAEHLKIQVTLHRVSGSWKKGNDKELFKRITGWQGRSNEETRSAAWFGYLGLKHLAIKPTQS